MRRHLKQRFWASDGDPGPLAWSLASVSLVLPILGLCLCLVGGWLLAHRQAGGWWGLGIGAAVLGLDIIIDLVWAHPGVSASDQPDLNRRSAQLIGRRGEVCEAVRDGRGKVRIGDSEWPAEGPDIGVGRDVVVTAVSGIGLVVKID